MFALSVSGELESGEAVGFPEFTGFISDSEAKEFSSTTCFSPPGELKSRVQSRFFLSGAALQPKAGWLGWV